MLAWFPDPQWWGAFGAVIAINLLLSGDNAVVIALACRGLPLELQRRAMLGGVLLAVGMRVVLTGLAVYLFSLPAVKLVGAILLAWIAVKLLAPDGEGEEGNGGNGDAWSAIRVILVADLVMSFDNVIAVAAAANGDWLLVVLGLLVSMPVIVYGSRLIMVLISRYPAVVMVGAALLGYVAGEMLVGEPLLEEPVLAGLPWLHDWMPPLMAIAVVGAGKAVAARQEALPIRTLGEDPD